MSAIVINNGNRTESSPIRFVIIRVINNREAGDRFVIQQTDLDDTKYCYQLIMNITLSEVFKT